MCPAKKRSFENGRNSQPTRLISELSGVFSSRSTFFQRAGIIYLSNRFSRSILLPNGYFNNSCIYSDSEITLLSVISPPLRTRITNDYNFFLKYELFVRSYNYQRVIKWYFQVILEFFNAPRAFNPKNPQNHLLLVLIVNSIFLKLIDSCPFIFVQNSSLINLILYIKVHYEKERKRRAFNQLRYLMEYSPH